MKNCVLHNSPSSLYKKRAISLRIFIVLFFLVSCSKVYSHEVECSVDSKNEQCQKDSSNEFSPSVASEALANLQRFTEKAYPLVSAKWGPKEEGVAVSIPVCWESPSMASEHATAREEVQEVVTQQWQANSLITFLGWGRCTTNSKGIRILVNDSGPHVKALGKNLNGVRNGMVLNFTYNTWSTSCKQQKSYCNKTIAIHEFGHALFFAHEHNRPDTPGECTMSAQGTDGDVLLTPWDKHSVMNYCNQKYSNDGILSKFDLYALQKFYGEPL